MAPRSAVVGPSQQVALEGARPNAGLRQTRHVARPPWPVGAGRNVRGARSVGRASQASRVTWSATQPAAEGRGVRLRARLGLAEPLRAGAAAVAGCQFQGSSSCRRRSGWSAMRASPSARQACGSTSSSLAVPIGPYMTAARSPPRSEPQNSHALRPLILTRTLPDSAISIEPVACFSALGLASTAAPAIAGAAGTIATGTNPAGDVEAVCTVKVQA